MKSKLAFEKDFLYELTINTEYEELPRFLQDAISYFVAMYYEEKRNDIFPIMTFKADTEWTWMANRGSLSKRISKWYKDHIGENLPEQILAQIGTIARMSSAKSKIYYFDFAKSFNWRAGDFADRDSCFWEGRSYIRKAMERDPRFYAIRFFGPPQKELKKNLNYYLSNHYGIGRAWMCVEEIETKIGQVEPVYIIFNGYGLHTGLITKIFSRFLGFPIKRIPISNHKEVLNGLYINNTGYIVGPHTTIQKVKNYDFGLPENNGRAHDNIRGTFVFLQGKSQSKSHPEPELKLERQRIPPPQWQPGMTLEEFRQIMLHN